MSRRRVEIDIDAARRLYEVELLPLTKIAAKFGVAPATVGKRLLEAGITLRKPGGNPGWQAEHGSPAMYQGGCRCPACIQVRARRTATRTRWAQRVRAETAAGRRPVREHGIAGYRLGCRCPVCTAANTATTRAWRRRQAGRG